MTARVQMDRRPRSAQRGEDARLVSIIIDNYNYGRYLKDAIDSALSQTYERVEVIVVDDGSTDDSRDIIARYGDEIIPVLKPNGGQASAFNEGFRRSRGSIVLFLDADDILSATTVAEAVAAMAEVNVSKCHWQMTVIDKNGASLDEVYPSRESPDGDLLSAICEDGPDQFLWPPTSANAWRSSFLASVMPLPEQLYLRGAETPLVALAPLFGRVVSLTGPRGGYRRHGVNSWRSMSFAAKLMRETSFYDHYAPLAAERCRDLGCVPDEDRWRSRSWWYRLRFTISELASILPPGQMVALLDDGAWGLDRIGETEVVPFPSADGAYAGIPTTDDEAVGYLRDIEADVAAVVVAWDSFWWLDHFPNFGRLLRTRQLLLENERVIVFAGTPKVPGSQ